MPGKTLRDVSASRFIAAYAQQLKSSGLEVPTYVEYVKTASFKEMGPENADWFYVRAAALLRTLYLRPGTGMGALRRRYGGAGNRGTRKHRKQLASPGIMRDALQGLEKLGLVERIPTGGRRVTAAGQKVCDRIAVSLSGGRQA